MNYNRNVQQPNYSQNNANYNGNNIYQQNGSVPNSSNMGVNSNNPYFQAPKVNRNNTSYK